MKKLEGILNASFRRMMKIAEEQAELSTCLRRKCGAVIFKEGKIFGRGFSSPAGGEEYRVCTYDKYSLDKKVTDKTCCQHAERFALDDALSRQSIKKLKDSIMVFAQVDEKNNPIFVGEPYCTKCSKDALTCGLKGWVLNHKKGLYFYEAGEYHNLSRAYSS